MSEFKAMNFNKKELNINNTGYSKMMYPTIDLAYRFTYDIPIISLL